jgi:RNA polymerase sigma-70 factor, ECF subfamily
MGCHVNQTQTDFQGNHDRLATLIGDHQRSLYLYIYSLVHRAEDAYDVLQETNLALWRDADRVEAVADFCSWAHRVAFNQVLAHRKRRVRDRLHFDETLLSQLADDMQVQEDPITNHQAVLRLCSQKMPEQSQRLLAMRYTSALSVERIAEQLGSTVASVSKALYRIRVALRKCVREALNRDGMDQESL